MLSSPPPKLFMAAAPHHPGGAAGSWFHQNQLARKLLTRPLWWWEKHRPYPIREKIFTLPPLPVPARADATLAVLATPGTLADAAWTARSVLTQLTAPVRLTFVVDGPVALTGQARMEQLFPNSVTISTGALVNEIAAHAPTLATLADRHPMLRKLAAVLALQRRGALLYSDADVLAFQPLPEIDEALGRVHDTAALYLQCVAETTHDTATLERVRERGLDCLATVNVGFLFIPQKSLDVALADDLLRGLDLTRVGWFPDTTLLAALLHRAGARPLSKVRYVVSPRRQFYWEEDVDYNQVSLRHFVTPVRHRMYGDAMPRLWKQWRQPAR